MESVDYPRAASSLTDAEIRPRQPEMMNLKTFAIPGQLSLRTILGLQPLDLTLLPIFQPSRSDHQITLEYYSRVN